MDLYQLFRPHVVFRSMTLWTFEHMAPSLLEIRSWKGSVQLGSRMIEVGERHELGVLTLRETPAVPVGVHLEILAERLQVRAAKLMSAPDSSELSGVWVKHSRGEFSVAAGAMPYSIAVRLDSREWGAPEYPWEAYRLNEHSSV